MNSGDAIKRPDLVEGWSDNIKSSWQKRGLPGILPWWLTLFLLIGFGVYYSVSKEFFTRPDLSIPLYVGILTIDGLFLGFSWSSFMKIYEAAGAPQFGLYLRRNGLLTKYFFHVDFIHVTQITAVLFAAGSLVSAIITDIPRWGQHIALALTVATLLYALKYALGAVRIIQDIVWYRAIYDGSANNRDGDVVRLHDGGR